MVNKDTQWNELEGLNSKLDFIRECVNLGTLDTTILTLLIFGVGIGLTILSIGFGKLTSSPILYVWSIYFVLLMVLLIIPIWRYTVSIFRRNGRFTNKKWVFLWIEGTYLFLGILFIELIGFSWYEAKIKPISSNTVLWFFFGGLILVAISLAIFSRKKNDNFLRKTFPLHYSQREKELKTLGRMNKSLKNVKAKLSTLRRSKRVFTKESLGAYNRELKSLKAKIKKIKEKVVETKG